MPAPYSAIRSAFTTRLLSLPDVPDIAWENKPFTPTFGVPYLVPALLPGEPSQAEIGTAGANLHPGIYQISIYAPAGKGPAQVEALRDSIINHFPRGLVLTYMGTSATITKAFPGPVLQDTDWVHIPITIRFRSYASN